MSRDAGRSSRDAQGSASDHVAAGSQSDPQPSSALAAVHSFQNPAGESDDPDMGRLRAYLDAGRLQSIFLAGHVGQMQQLYHRSMNSGTTSKAHQLLQGMQATGNEAKQLQSVTEMCQLLVMGNEDTLSGFPTKTVVPALITLLKMEHNFDMMNHACRALTYMMDALPRTSAVVVDAAPAFLERLQSIQCMDVAEQSLKALEMLSRRHAASILKANGLSSCLLYVDFFSLPAQRNALTVAANCCSILSPSEQHSDFDKYCGNSIALLVQRLSHHDKKCVEIACLCCARLVDNFHSHADILQKIASVDLLQNFQNLLVLTPPLIGSNTFVMVIRTLTLLCSSCPNLAAQLVRNNIAETLRYLLCGTATEEDHIELVSRRPQELYEITALIGELMPRLPTDDPMFSVNRLLKKSSKGRSDESSPVWQWRGGDGTWHPYTKHDNRIIEEARSSGDQEASLLIQGHVYLLDFTTMQQVNEDTGNLREIRRKTDIKAKDDSSVAKIESSIDATDARVFLVKEDRLVISQFVRLLFTLLYEVYGSSVGSPTVRHKCLRAVQRMIYHAEPDLLRDVLKHLSVSSHIASMMSSSDLKVVVGALQMAMILMKKLPDVFEVYFRRHGVTHQIELFVDPNHKVVGTTAPVSPPAGSNNPTSSATTTPIFEGAPASSESSPSDPFPGRLSDLLKRKRPAGKRFSSTSSPLTPTPEDKSQPLSSTSRSGLTSPTDQAALSKAFAAAMAADEDTPTGPKSRSGSSSRSPTSFFFNLNPSRWRRSNSSSSPLSSSSNAASRIQSLLASSSLEAAKTLRENQTLSNLKKNELRENKEKVRQWLREQARLFLENHFARETLIDKSNDQEKSDEASLLDQLTYTAKSLLSCTDISNAYDTLRSLGELISASDMSSFELQHSGVITSLIVFLTQEPPQNIKKENTLKRRSSPPSPMMTRRRSKTTSSSTNQSLEIEKSIGPFESNRPKTSPSDSRNRVRRTLEIRTEFSFERTDFEAKRSTGNSIASMDRDEKLRCFLDVFVGLPNTYFSKDIISTSDLSNPSPFRVLVEKLNLCISQLEQFAVNTHDLPNALGRGAQVLSFLARNQLKCLLKRHPDCKNSKQWHGGPVRVDPLALVQAIEKHLVTRGYGAVSSDGGSSSEKRDIFMLLGDDNSEDEIDAEDHSDDEDEFRTFSTGTSRDRSSTSTSSNKHRLELYIDENKLPCNMTVYQAVKRFTEDGSLSVSSSDDMEVDDDSLSLSNANIWNAIHTIHYKLVPDDTAQPSIRVTGNKREPQKGSPKSSKKHDNLFLNGIVSPLTRPLDRYLVDSLSSSFSTTDPSIEVLCLMKIIFGLSVHWHSLYHPSALKDDRTLVDKTQFINKKLSTKAHRQLQDPLMIMTGNLPPWLRELAHSCPFLLPFETRQLLFRIVSFDRDRAMLYLLETGALPELNNSLSSSASSSLSHNPPNRFMPKLQKKKCVVKRENLLSQAEKLMQEHASPQSLLEVQYEGEVGTGLGPTLEFYTLASHEFQRSDLSLWRSDEKSSTVESIRTSDATSLKKMVKKLSAIVEGEEMALFPMDAAYAHSPVGLYPLPIGRNTKSSAIGKTKAKFTFLGKFLAKSVLDGRMADIPLSVVCYKWLLGKKDEITWFDLNLVDPDFTLTFNKLKNVLHQRLVLEKEGSSDVEEKISSITMDGCSLEDLGLDFQLPGFPNIELMKGGTKTPLSINNIDKYLSLIAHWTLVEGVRQQLDAMKEGFQSVFPLQTIEYFFPEELDELFCGARYQPWNETELAESCLTDHGYNHDSAAVKTLFRVLSQYDVAEQRAFLQFVTGSPHLPVGGFKSLHPQLTIVRKSSEEGHKADEYLPSVMTCVNYLKLPEYSSESVMRQRLNKAAREGQKSFLLS